VQSRGILARARRTDAGLVGFALGSGRHASCVTKAKRRATLPPQKSAIVEGRALSHRLHESPAVRQLRWAATDVLLPALGTSCRVSHLSCRAPGGVVALHRRCHQHVRGPFPGATLHESADAEQGVEADEAGRGVAVSVASPLNPVFGVHLDQERTYGPRGGSVVQHHRLRGNADLVYRHSILASEARRMRAWWASR
jgi:hypothetical protein